MRALGASPAAMAFLRRSTTGTAPRRCLGMAALPLVLLLGGGCAFIGSPALTYASLVADGASFAFTGKMVGSHVLSAVTDQDCAIIRMISGEEICRDHGSGGLGNGLAAVKAPAGTNGIAGTGIATTGVVTKAAFVKPGAAKNGTNGTNGTKGTKGAAAADADGSRMLLVSVPGNTRFNVRVKSLAELRFTKVVRQRYDVSCGAAALATLFTYFYDMPITEKQILDDIFKHSAAETEAKIKKYGFSMLELKRAGERLGFKTGGFRLPDVKKLVKLKIPVITLVNIRGYNHFVVIKGVAGGQVFIADPAFGNRTRPLEGFAEEWGKVVLVFLSATRSGNDKFVRDGTLRGRADGLINIFDRGVRSRIAPVSGEF